MLVREPFSSLFDVTPETKAAVYDSMSKKGYDPSYPVILACGPWTDQSVLINGQTRLTVADELGINNVPIIRKRFNTEDEAIRYAISNRLIRRRFSDAELCRLLMIIDKERLEECVC